MPPNSAAPQGAVASLFSAQLDGNPLLSLTNSRPTVFSGKSFCRGDEGGMGGGTRDKLLRGARSDPKSPRAVLVPLPAPTAAGGGGEGAAGAREAEAPGPGRAAAASSPWPRGRRGCGPGFPACTTRFRMISKIIIQIKTIESTPADRLVRFSP